MATILEKRLGWSPSCALLTKDRSQALLGARFFQGHIARSGRLLQVTLSEIRLR